MREFKVVVLGDGGVGKSALTVRFVTGKYEEKYDPTIEDFYRKEIIVGGVPCMLEILDTAGTEQFASLQDLYIKNGQGFVIVYSITCLQSLHDVQAIRDQIIKVKASDSRYPGPNSHHPHHHHHHHRDHQHTPSNQHTAGCIRPPPIVLVGNKIDLEEEGLREVPHGQGEAMARKWGCCAFIETSARTGVGVKEAFLEVVQWVMLPNLMSMLSFSHLRLLITLPLLFLPLYPSTLPSLPS
ncbi:unnamed protein product [Mesocestoides corti]|uniref:Small monomeric GTPase n=1 Tax=Mesocestoides corti TaxID=53468 RepID=A0A0R3UPY4_MESCO|nr:unnamed protein product [Mesocestoides corti]